ncbi:MAG: CvpA family protein [Flavobacteriaceae bacterium]|nr:CvpA family protein [Flavobacteriaceae bacterium]
MSFVDIVLGGILALGLINGFRKGLFVEITSLLGLVLGVYGAIHFSYYLANILEDKVSWNPSLIQIAAFAGTFLIIVIVISLLGKILTKIAETIFLGAFNKILGALFGLVKFALILSVILIIVNRFNKVLKFRDDSKVGQSILYEPIQKFAPAIFPKLVTIVEETNEK